MTKQKLEQILRLHRLWMESFDQGGEQANLAKADLTGANLRGANLAGADLSDTIFVGANLEEAILGHANLTGANLTGAKLDGANLQGADLSYANLEMAEISYAILAGAKLSHVTSYKTSLIESDLSRAIIVEADLSYANCRKAILKSANLTKSKFRFAFLNDADLSNATLREVDAEGSNLSNANMSGAILVDANLVDCHMVTVALPDANMLRANMSGADLQGADLFNASLIGAKLTKTNFYRASLYQADLTRANLEGANLEGANLTEANLTEANLTRANFNSASLTRANLIDAELYHTSFRNADITDADLSGAILEGVIGLDLSKPDPKPKTAYGRARRGVKALAKVTEPMKIAAFKRTFPDAFETVKHDIGGGTLTPEAARELIDRYGMTWQITMSKWDSELQRLNTYPNDVLQLNIDPALVTDEAEVLKTIEAIRKTSHRSKHPVLGRGLFTIGWVRYSNIILAEESILVEEVQSDLPIVRKGLSDDEFKRQLASHGLTDAAIKEALDILQPFADRFYHDALSLIFDIAAEAGIPVEMLSYEQKQQFGSPRSLYEDLPKSMGMRRAESKIPFIEGKTWQISPNPARPRRRVKVPKLWSRS